MARQVLQKTSFPTLQSLVELLTQYTIPIAEWGATTTRTKTVQQLYEEILAGETILEKEDHTETDPSKQLSSSLKRVVHVACVKVRRKEDVLSHSVEINKESSVPAAIIEGRNRWLVEARQRFADGRERERNSLLSEKIMSGESEEWEKAAVRGIQEELGSLNLSESQVELIEGTHYMVEETEDSHSYPGLLSKYILHNVEAFVAGLPAEPFSTIETDSDGKMKLESFWIWFEPEAAK